MISIEQYKEAFKAESVVKYPVIDALEEKYGYALDYKILWEAAAVLACPVKVNPPNWQHGRVIYAVLRDYIERPGEKFHVVCLDVGTAKGFSALCAAHAIKDSGCPGSVYSVDVINPLEKAKRNSIADTIHGPTTVRELLAVWPNHTRYISLEQSSGVDWLKRGDERVHFAFIDGKHSYEVVKEELRLLGGRQLKGDVAIADDLQVPGVERAVAEISHYRAAIVNVLPNRRYAILRRK